MTSSDAGVSFHYNLPSNYGDIHVGVYNGENYQKVETNNQKGLEARGTLRPFATMDPLLRGLRVHFVYYNDSYNSGGDTRSRLMGNVTFEHKYLNAGFDYLSAKDQTLQANAEIPSKGYSFWATPKAPQANGSSFEALLRYDHFVPNTTTALAGATATNPGVTVLNDQERNETIAGVAYWFPHQGNVSTAILLDYDGQSFNNITTAPVKAIAIHGLVNF